MTDDAFKTAESRGYDRGYAAALRRTRREHNELAERRKRDAFWLRAYLAALPAVIASEGWKTGDRVLTNGSDRVGLAKWFADESLALAAEENRL